MGDMENSDVAVLEQETDVVESQENVVDGDFFSELAHDYGLLKALVDAIVRVRNEKDGPGINQAIADAIDVVDRFEIMSENGQSYTPPARLELTSENAATIALNLLRRKPSASSVCTKFAKFGK